MSLLSTKEQTTWWNSSLLCPHFYLILMLTTIQSLNMGAEQILLATTKPSKHMQENYIPLNY
jgi:hypothetical protein